VILIHRIRYRLGHFQARITKSRSLYYSPMSPTTSSAMSFSARLPGPGSRYWIQLAGPFPFLLLKLLVLVLLTYRQVTQKFISRVPDSTLSEVTSAVAAADAALSGWATLPPSKRRKLMLNLLAVLPQYADRIVSRSLPCILAFYSRVLLIVRLIACRSKPGRLSQMRELSSIVASTPSRRHVPRHIRWQETII